VKTKISLAQKISVSSLAAIAQRPGQSLAKLLCQTRQLSAVRKASRLTSRTTGYFCPNWAGCATATAGTSWALRKTSRTGKKRGRQVRTEQSYPGSRLVRVPAAAGLQARLKRRDIDSRAAAIHQPDLPLLRACRQSKPENASPIRVHRLRPCKQRRCRRRDEYIGAGLPRCSLWRGRLWPCAQAQDETSLSEAGTHQSNFNGHNAG
jgi:hypothetical protein